MTLRGCKTPGGSDSGGVSGGAKQSISPWSAVNTMAVLSSACVFSSASINRPTLWST